jgi:hypothetical protein
MLTFTGLALVVGLWVKKQKTDQDKQKDPIC